MVYNQKYLAPRKPRVKRYLQNYIPYIAKHSQSNIGLNDGANHGLFGCIKNSYLPQGIDSLKSTTQYIIKKSQEDQCILYHGFISLSAKEVMQEDYTSRQKWEQLLASKMSDVAKANNIKVENLEWISALHVKKDQSHCHLIFWDKRQAIKQPHIPKALFTEKMEWLRGRFARAVFQDTLKELYNQKDEAFRDMKDAIHPFFDEFNTIISDMTKGEYIALKEQLSAISPDYADVKMINSKFTDEQIQRVAKEIVRIKDIVPSKGSLKYQFLPQKIKEQVNQAVIDIIHSNAACRSAYYAYLNSSRAIRKVFADNPTSLEEAETQARSAILKSIGNALLKAVKEIGKLKKEFDSFEWQDKHQNFEKQAAGNLIMKIAFILGRGAKSNQAKVSRLMNCELSKQAKIELAKKLENKSLDWGQYER